MLIVSIGSTSTSLEVLHELLPRLSPRNSCVAALLPDVSLSRGAIDELLAHCCVIDFLTPPERGLTLLAEVCHRLDHLLERDEGPLVFVNRPATLDEIITLIDRSETDNHAIRHTHDTAGRLIEFTIGANIMANPLLPRFVQMLHKRGLDDRRSIDLLRDTFGEPAA